MQIWICTVKLSASLDILDELYKVLNIIRDRDLKVRTFSI